MKKTKENKLPLDELICSDSFQRWVFENKKLDKKYWETYLLKNPESFELIEEARIYLLAFHEKEKIAPAKSKREIWFRIETCKKRKTRLIYYRSIAAILLVFILCGSAWFLYERNLSNQLFAGTNQEIDFSKVSDIKLILSDNEEHQISGDQSNITFEKQGNQVVINEEVLAINKQKNNQLNQVIVPFGKRTNLTLEDGTLVYLNAGSKLVFPSHFNKNKREVYLAGEAYFEVFHNNEVPFYVVTSEHKIKVLGTKFDVKAYSSAPVVSTVLIEGKVVLQTENSLGVVKNEVYLAPNQKAVFRKDDGRFTVKDEPNALFYASWKDGWMYFSKQPLLPVLAQIERYYNVRFDTENLQLLHGRISGKLDLKDSLDDVLNVISRLAKVSFQENGDKIQIIHR